MCGGYSNRAMPQLMKAAMYQARLFRFFRWPYQAKVMKMFDRTRRPAVWNQMGRAMSEDFLDRLAGHQRQVVVDRA